MRGRTQLGAGTRHGLTAWALAVSVATVTACSVEAPVGGSRSSLDGVARVSPGRVPPEGAELSEASQRALAHVPAGIDVLLFPPRRAAASRVTVGPDWYAVAVESDDGVGFHLLGSDRTHARLGDEELADIELADTEAPRESVRGARARSTVNEGTRVLSWREGDVYYALEVHCHRRPLEDPRCVEPGFARELADSLVEVSR